MGGLLLSLGKSVLWLNLLFVWFWSKVSLCSPGYSGTYRVAKAGLEFLELSVLQLSNRCELFVSSSWWTLEEKTSLGPSWAEEPLLLESKVWCCDSDGRKLPHRASLTENLFKTTATAETKQRMTFAPDLRQIKWCVFLGGKHFVWIIPKEAVCCSPAWYSSLRKAVHLV